MAMFFLIQRPQTPFSQRYTELDRQICRQFGSLIDMLRNTGLIDHDVDGAILAQMIFNNLNMMFIELVKSDTMTIDELRTTVERQMPPVTSLISSQQAA